MRRLALAAMLVLPSLMGSPGSAWAQSSQPSGGEPGVISGGSTNTTIGGMPAVRDGDRTTSGGAVTGSSTNVFINGRPATVVGDKTDCGGITIGGGGGVFINGHPAARTGDITTGCPEK